MRPLPPLPPSAAHLPAGSSGAGGAWAHGPGSGTGPRRTTLSNLVQAVRSRRSTASFALEPASPTPGSPAAPASARQQAPGTGRTQGSHGHGHGQGLSDAQAAALPSIRAALELRELEAAQDGGIFKHTRCERASSSTAAVAAAGLLGCVAKPLGALWGGWCHSRGCLPDAVACCLGRPLQAGRA
jgi:hypothetical protein